MATSSSKSSSSAVATPVTPGSSSAKAGIVGYTAGGGAIYGSNAPSNISQGSSSNSDNTNRYNPNTGQLLAPGETVQIGNTGKTVTQGTQFVPTSTIAVSQINTKSPNTFQDTVPNMSLYNQGINQSRSTLGTYYNADGTPKNEQQVSQAYDTNSSNNLMAQIRAITDANNAMPSQAEMYRQAQQETGVLEKQRRANELSGQLNSIVAQGQANQLSVVGQGRGIPEAILGGQQAQFARETAIASLPVSAQLAAAQGDLEMAEKNLNTLFTIKAADAKQQHESKLKVIDIISQFTTKQEDIKLAQVTKSLDRQYAETQAMQATQQSYAKMAFDNNQSKLGAQIASLDTKSPTYKTDFANLQSKIYDPSKALDIQLKKAQLANQYASLARTKAETASTVGAGTQSSSSVEKSFDDINKLKDVLSNKAGITTSSGVSNKRVNPFIANKVNDWRANVNNILAQTTLAELARIKGTGVTFGALSEGERNAVGAASTALNAAMIYEGEGDSKLPTGRFKASEKFVKDNLALIQKYAELDFERRNGIKPVEYEKQRTANTAETYLNTVDTTLKNVISDPYAQAGYYN
jgi:hypothetical protein